MLGLRQLSRRQFPIVRTINHELCVCSNHSNHVSRFSPKIAKRTYTDKAPTSKGGNAPLLIGGVVVTVLPLWWSMGIGSGQKITGDAHKNALQANDNISSDNKGDSNAVKHPKDIKDQNSVSPKEFKAGQKSYTEDRTQDNKPKKVS